jgi:hypothetical protein
MTPPWASVPAADVKVGDRVRVASGHEALVSQIEPTFMGMDAMIAFIEDTPERWFKMPVPKTADVEVQRPG